MKQTRHIHRAWYMLAGCCLLQGGAMGLVNNCRGIFISPVTSDLGFSMSSFTLYMFVSAVCGCIVMPFVSRMFERIDSRLLLGGAGLLFSGSVFSMGFADSILFFQIAGVVQGISGAFLMFYPAPFILGNWFYKKSGLAVGICSSFSGVIGILFNPIGNAVIERFGWRGGYFFFGVAVFLMLVPVSVFLLRLRPADAGLLPYGQEGAPETAAAGAPAEGVPAQAAKRSVYFWMIVFGTLLITAAGSFNAHLSPMGISYGYGARIGALLVSCSMAGNVLSKNLLGILYDHLGLRRALIFGVGASALGCALLLIDSVPVRVIGAFLFGSAMGTNNVATPLVIKDVFGLRDYGELLSYNTLFMTFGNSLALLFGGVMVDAFGAQRGYFLSFVIVLCMLALLAVLYAVAVRGGRRLRSKYDAVSSPQ